MIQSLIAGIILGGLTVIFALQNVGIVTVQVLAWQISAPLALIVLMSMLCGISITLLSLLPGYVRDAMYLRAIKREKREIEEEFAKHRIAAHGSQPSPLQPHATQTDHRLYA